MSGFIKYSAAIATVLVAGSFSFTPEAKATDMVDALERACTVAAGRYEDGWSYDDKGVHWGRLTICTTATAQVTCQDNICHVVRRGIDTRRAVAVKDKSYDKRGVRVEAKRSEFDRVLGAIAMY